MGDREARFAESAAIIAQFLRGDRVTFEGPNHTFTNVPVAPRPVHSRLPLLVAAGTDASLRVAAELGDGWVSYGGHVSRGPAERGSVGMSGAALVRQRWDRVAAVARIARRDPDSIRRIYLMVGPEEPDWSSAAPLVDTIGLYREAGVREFAFPWPMDPDRRTRAERLLAKVRSQIVDAA